MENLIGRKFKRNVYGLSVWTEEIKHVGATFELRANNDLGFVLKPSIIVKGKSGKSYKLDEIVILMDDDKIERTKVILEKLKKFKEINKLKNL